MTEEYGSMENQIKIAHISAFPKIFHIGEDFITNLFKGEVEITEKIDGSQFDFGIDPDGIVVFRSHYQQLTYKPVPRMFEKAKEQVDRIISILQENNLTDIYFYCEYLSKPKHNILNYGRVPKNNLYLFGMKEGRSFVSDSVKLGSYADLMDIERPRVLYIGEVKDVKELEEYLDCDSVLGSGKIEGIVIKNYNEPAVMGSIYLPVSMGKYVSEKYKEKHGTEWKGSFTSKGKLEIFLGSFQTEARWDKAIQHLKEDDKLENAPKDIGKLIVEIERDLIEEEAETIKNGLYRIFVKDIVRKTTRGFPEHYKKKLMERGFTKEKK